MNISSLQSEKTIDALAQRLYGDLVRRRPDLIESLAAANPHLTRIAELPAGTPVLVPASGDATVDGGSAASDDPRKAEAIAELTASLDDLEKRGGAVLSQRQAAFDESIRIATLPEVRRAAEGETARALEELVSGARGEIERLPAAKNALAADLASARAALHPGRRRPSGK